MNEEGSLKGLLSTSEMPSAPGVIRVVVEMAALSLKKKKGASRTESPSLRSYGMGRRISSLEKNCRKASA